MLTGGDTPSAVAAADLPAATVQAEATSLAKLTKRQRDTALARLAFVREIERATPLVGKEAAIRNLVRAAKDSALAPRLAGLVAVANDRMTDGRGLSRRRLYDWCRMFAAGGEAALAPHHPGKIMAVPGLGADLPCHLAAPAKTDRGRRLYGVCRQLRGPVTCSGLVFPTPSIFIFIDILIF